MPSPAHFGLIHDGLAYWARHKPDTIAASIDGAAISYAALDHWSDGVAEYLGALDVNLGCNVAIASTNRLDWIAAAFGIAKAGATIVPFNDRLVADELAYLSGNSQPRLIIADTDRAQRLQTGGVDTPIIAMDDLNRFRAGASAGWREIRPSSDAVSMIIFTSGSTARPKGAMLTHDSYLLKFMEMRMLDASLGPDTRAFMPFGLHSSPGLPWGIFFTSILGGTLYATTKYDAAQTLDLLTGERISFFLGVPMIYDQISKLPAFADADLSALAFARIGGATPQLQTLARWREKHVVVRQLYGMTEVGGGSIIASHEEALAKPMSCGRGLAFSRFRIVRDDGSECDADEVGNVLLSGPGLMKGYWGDPDATKMALVDGWMHTGDMGSRDADGYFTFIDRAKEMIKSGGFNVSPAEIEGVIAAIPGVIEVAAFAIPDEKFSEVPCVCVRAEAGVTHTTIVDYCSSRMAGFKLPRKIVMIEEPLPRLANEKIDRRALKAIYGDGSDIMFDRAKALG